MRCVLETIKGTACKCGALRTWERTLLGGSVNSFGALGLKPREQFDGLLEAEETGPTIKIIQGYHEFYYSIAGERFILLTWIIKPHYSTSPH